MDIDYLIVTSDKKYIVSAGVGGVRAWDFTTGEFSHTILRTTWPVKLIDMLPSGNLVAFRDRDKFVDQCEICICNTHTGIEIWRSYNNLYLSWQVVALNNEEIVFLESHKGVAIYRWRWRTGKRPNLLATHSYFIDKLRATVDGDNIIFIDRNENLEILNISEEKIVHSKYGYIDAIPHPDCERVICKTSDEELHVIEWRSGRIVQNLESKEEPISRYSSLAITMDGQYVASGIGFDATAINVWDVDSGQLRWSITDRIDSFYRITFTPDGKHLVTGGKETVKIWDLETQQCVLSFST